MVEMTVRAYLYRWNNNEDALESFTLHQLEVPLALTQLSAPVTVAGLNL